MQMRLQGQVRLQAAKLKGTEVEENLEEEVDLVPSTRLVSHGQQAGLHFSH